MLPPQDVCQDLHRLLPLARSASAAVKWWAWRHFSGTRINSGGDVLIGRTIGAWYSAPITGALLDLLDFGLLSVQICATGTPRSGVADAPSTPGAGLGKADDGLHRQMVAGVSALIAVGVDGGAGGDDVG